MPTQQSPEVVYYNLLNIGLCLNVVPTTSYTVTTIFIWIISSGSVNSLEWDFWVKGDKQVHILLSTATFAKAVFREVGFLEKCFQGQLEFSL